MARSSSTTGRAVCARRSVPLDPAPRARSRPPVRATAGRDRRGCARSLSRTSRRRVDTVVYIDGRQGAPAQQGVPPPVRKHLRAPWRWAYAFRWMPGFVLDLGYRFVAATSLPAVGPRRFVRAAVAREPRALPAVAITARRDDRGQSAARTQRDQRLGLDVRRRASRTRRSAGSSSRARAAPRSARSASRCRRAARRRTAGSGGAGAPSSPRAACARAVNASGAGK